MVIIGITCSASMATRHGASGTAAQFLKLIDGQDYSQILPQASQPHLPVMTRDMMCLFFTLFFSSAACQTANAPSWKKSRGRVGFYREIHLEVGPILWLGCEVGGAVTRILGPGFHLDVWPKILSFVERFKCGNGNHGAARMAMGCYLPFAFAAMLRIFFNCISSTLSKPTCGSRGVSVAQFGSPAKTFWNNGNESSRRPALTSATAVQ